MTDSTEARLRAELADCQGKLAETRAVRDLVDLLSAALDEIYMLRRALAYEARVVEAQALDLKSLSWGRRHVLATAVQRMRGGVTAVAKSYSGIGSRSLDAEAKRCGFEYLTRGSWEREVHARRFDRAAERAKALHPATTTKGTS